MNKLSTIFFGLVEDMIRNIGGGLGRRLRYTYYKNRLKSCGTDVLIDTGVYFESVSSISIGDNVWIDKNVILIAGKIDKGQINYIGERSEYEGEILMGSNIHLGINTIIQGHGGVFISDYFTTSAGCKIYTYSNNPKRCRKGTVHSEGSAPYYIMKSIFFEKNVWLGLNVSVLGARIGEDSFIKPNSVVISDIEANSIGEGSPAQKVKERFVS